MNESIVMVIVSQWGWGNSYLHWNDIVHTLSGAIMLRNLMVADVDKDEVYQDLLFLRKIASKLNVLSIIGNTRKIREEFEGIKNDIKQEKVA